MLCAEIHRHYHPHPHEPGQFPLPRSSAPQHPRFLVCGDIEGFEGDCIGFEDRFEPRGGGDDVR